MHSEQNRNIETLTHEETLSNQVFALTMTLNYSFYSLRNSTWYCGAHGVHGIPASFFFFARWHYTRVYNISWRDILLHHVSISSMVSLRELSSLSSVVDRLSRSDRSNAGRGVLQNWKELNEQSSSSLSSGRVTCNSTGIMQLMSWNRQCSTSLTTHNHVMCKVNKIIIYTNGAV